MLELERQMYRWINIEQTDVAELKEKHQLLTDTGYNYTCKLNGKHMVEFHVDTCEKFHKIGKKTTKWGGNLSVRLPVGIKLVILIGHNKYIFKQYQFTNQSWVADKKLQPIIPKEEGTGVMISAFQSRELGFGRLLAVEELKKVNEKRENEKYLDKGAALLKKANRKGSTHLHSLSS